MEIQSPYHSITYFSKNFPTFYRVSLLPVIHSRPVYRETSLVLSMLNCMLHSLVFSIQTANRKAIVRMATSFAVLRVCS